MSDFYGYFKENMEGLGLPAPASLFGLVLRRCCHREYRRGDREVFGGRNIDG